MVLTELEERILQTIAKSHLLTKSELRNSINPSSSVAVDSAIKSLLIICGEPPFKNLFITSQQQEQQLQTT